MCHVYHLSGVMHSASFKCTTNPSTLTGALGITPHPPPPPPLLSFSTPSSQSKIGPKVKEWLNSRLPIWLDEHPHWFDDQKMSIIPEDLVEDPALLVRVRTKNVNGIIEGRRKSALGLGGV